MLKTALGFVLAFAIGAACRWIDIPVPAPNKLVGALLVLAVTLGYLAADRALGPGQTAPGASEPPSQFGPPPARPDTEPAD